MVCGQGDSGVQHRCHSDSGSPLALERAAMNRRGFITGLFSAAVAAPAIIRVIDLMPVRAVSPVRWRLTTMTEIEDYLANTTCPLGRMLLACQFAYPLDGGVVYRATRWDRIPRADFS